VRRAVTRTVHGQSHAIPHVEFYECPDCRERVYDREAMRQIEAATAEEHIAHLVK